MIKGKLIEVYEKEDEQYGNDTLYDQNFMDLMLKAKKELLAKLRESKAREEEVDARYGESQFWEYEKWFKKWFGEDE